MADCADSSNMWIAMLEIIRVLSDDDFRASYMLLYNHVPLSSCPT